MISGRGNLRGNRDGQRASSRDKAKFWTPPAGPPPATLQPVKLCKAVTMDQTRPTKISRAPTPGLTIMTPRPRGALPNRAAG